MNIKIGDYVLTSDTLNVILNVNYEKQKEGQVSGEIGTKPVSYHPTMEAACLALFNREIRVSDTENLGELVKLIYDTKRSIVEAVRAVELEGGKANVI